MTAHKHAAMIKAKADNMDLVVFRKHHDGEWIEVADQSEIRIKQSGEYFLCLPEHNKNGECLSWLNGRDCTISFESVRDVSGLIKGDGDKEWRRDCGFMNESAKIKIKPRKEKRWIAVCNSGYNCIDKLFDNKNQAREFVTAFYPNNRVDDFQFIEIEVEI